MLWIWRQQVSPKHQHFVPPPDGANLIHSEYLVQKWVNWTGVWQLTHTHCAGLHNSNVWEVPSLNLSQATDLWLKSSMAFFSPSKHTIWSHNETGHNLVLTIHFQLEFITILSSHYITSAVDTVLLNDLSVLAHS